MSEHKHSDVEIFYASICAKLGVQRKWSELHPMEQHQFVQGLNLIFQVVNG